MKASLPMALQRYTLAEIAKAVGAHKTSLLRRANKEAWQFEVVPHPGGEKRLYPVATLPADIREALSIVAAAEAAAKIGSPAQTVVATPAAPSVPAVNAVQPLKTTQVDAELARERLFQFIRDFDGPEERAIDHLNAHYHSATLPGPLAWAMDNAWVKRRSDTRLSRSVLNKWRDAKKKRGRAAPLVRQKDMTVKPWYGLAVALKQRPQGSCFKWIAEQIEKKWEAGWGDTPPSYGMVRHFLNEKFSQIELLKGRHTGSALAPHRHFVKRTSVGMLPWDEVHADGWNTHFTAPHPVTGEYVTYELWHAHDVATRYVPPFGIGLTENFEVILKCVEEALRFGGCMAILQTDSTKIVKHNEKFQGFADRVGFTVVHPQTVGNSQANGIAENFNAWMDKESRELATYQAKGMDSLALKRVKKLTDKAMRAQKAGDHDGYALALNEAERMGKGRVFRSHEEACTWLEEKRQKWNDKPHASLPKIRDAETGRMRHQSPNEAMQLAREAGWVPVAIEEEMLIVLCRPRTRVTVRREAVSPYGGMRYHDACLGDWNGKEVVVAYDMMDWKRVWVETLEGAPICTAAFSESVGYRTQSAKEAADEKRAMAQIKRRERQIETIRERVGMDAIDGESVRLPERPAIEAEVISLVPRLSDAELEAIEAKQKQKKPMSMQEMAMWLFEDEIAKKESGEPPTKESAAV